MDRPNDAKPIMDEVFRFKVGDVVARRIDVEKWRADVEANDGVRKGGVAHAPEGAVVVERMLLECHGGVQCIYLISRCEERRQVTGAEIVPYSEARDAAVAVGEQLRVAAQAEARLSDALVAFAKDPK